MKMQTRMRYSGMVLAVREEAVDRVCITSGQCSKKVLSGRLIVRLNVFDLKLNKTWRKQSDYSAMRWIRLMMI